MEQVSHFDFIIKPPVILNLSIHSAVLLYDTGIYKNRPACHFCLAVTMNALIKLKTAPGVFISKICYVKKKNRNKNLTVRFNRHSHNMIFI